MGIDLSTAGRLISNLRSQVQKSIFGQDDLIDEVIVCLISGGHILMTGAPGLAKTTLVRVVAKNLGLHFGRVQFTPDLLPGDITGSDVLSIDPETSKRFFDFNQGPIFTNLLLADEINRASPRTQSALLEAMQERTCTVGGKKHPLPVPFMVLATQNPYESEGTFPLPEAQLDRFLIHSLVNYPDSEAEFHMLNVHTKNELVGEQLSFDEQAKDACMSESELIDIIALAREVKVDELIVKAVLELVRLSRPDDPDHPSELTGAMWYGAGPRAGLSLLSTGRAFALLQGRSELRWHDVRRLAKPVLRHRIKLSAQAMHDQITEDSIIEQLLETVESRHSQLEKDRN